MSETHDSEHELWLAGLLAGELRRDAPEVARRLAVCAPCRERLDELASVAAELAGAGADQRADLDLAARAGAAPGEERVSARLAELAEREPHAPRSRRVWPWLVAAAALIVVGLAWRALLRPPGEAGPILLGARIEIESPRGLGSFERFSWRYDGSAGPASGGYALRIYEETGEHLLLRAPCRATTWTPDAATLSSLPHKIRWAVDALGDFGADYPPLASSDPVSAWRSP